MVSVIANVKGYHGGTIREPGEPFELEEKIWNDEKRRPKWVRLARKALTEALASETAGENEPDEQPEVPEPETPAKPEKPKGNGVKEALGTAPDWLPPEGVPKAVTA